MASPSASVFTSALSLHSFSFFLMDLVGGVWGMTESPIGMGSHCRGSAVLGSFLPPRPPSLSHVRVVEKQKS